MKTKKIAPTPKKVGLGSIDITPTPRILRTLGEIPFQPWQCLAELLDNSIDAFAEAKRNGLSLREKRIGEIACPRPARIVLSLEVGEHIPAEKARDYINFIRSTGAEFIYFSAAAPGQGGEGHINCQPKEYWSEIFCMTGFYYHHSETVRWLRFMSEGYHMGWLIQNGQVFRRAKNA